MKIAIVAPCPVPYLVGGAEKLWWGLARHFNDATPHQADIIKLPSPEADFDSLIDSYERFAELRLDGFDCIISSKYPAWMVSHPNHVVYLQHRLRGLYDSYPPDLPVRSPYARTPAIAALLNLMEQHAGDRSALPQVFDICRKMRADGGIASEAFDLPGPLVRAIVHFLDGVALDPRAIRRFATIAATVARRPGYFPEAVEVGIAHHPSNLELSTGDRFEYFLTASRLDGPKRVGLIIEAMRHVKDDTELWIAGVGPDEARLRQLASGDSRIRFLGFVSDRELAELYSGALAVPFVPYQEDYGLVTIEAMMAGKPVVTTDDSGGPTELVRDGETGFVVAATPRAIGAALQRLADEPEFARRLGAAAHIAAQTITWDGVVETLLPIRTIDASAHVPRAPKSRKLLVATTFPVWPPRYGGQVRVFHLYRELAREFDVVIVGLADPSLPPLDHEIAPGLREVRVPKTHVHAAKEAAASALYGLPVSDIMATELLASTPAYREALIRESKDATVLVACHPYLYPALAAVAGQRPIWYEAQDIESHLKATMLPDGPDKPALLSKVAQLERACCATAQWVFPCSDEDARTLQEEFGVAAERIEVVWNGTDIGRIPFVSREARARHKAKLGVAAPLVLFMASGHQPNIDAAHQIFTMARELPQISFVLIGRVAYAFQLSAVPGNVWLLGEVSEIGREIVLEAVDIAINPLRTGSGTSLKMLDYFAAGIPVIATPTGARGLPIIDGEHLLIRELEDFPRAIVALLKDEAAADRLAARSRALVEQQFDWKVIGDRLLARVLSHERTQTVGTM